MPVEFAPGVCFSEEALRRHFKRCGPGVKVFRGCRIHLPEQVELGAYCQIDEGVFIFAGESVVIGVHAHLAFQSSISGGGRVRVGDYAGIGAGVRLISGSEDPHGGGLTNPTIPAALRSVRRGRVEVGAYALVFTNSVVLPDVCIGEGAVVAAGSVVHRTLKPWTVYAGSPLVAVGVRDPKTTVETMRKLLEQEAES